MAQGSQVWELHTTPCDKCHCSLGLGPLGPGRDGRLRRWGVRLLCPPWASANLTHLLQALVFPPDPLLLSKQV